jgi:redox-sensing transcriptional repressor
VGYRVPELRAHLTSLMGLDRLREIVIVGAGNLGQALADSRNFNRDGFRVVALYDVDGRKVGGRSRTGLAIRDVGGLSAALQASTPDIGVIAVPADAAPGLASQLAAAGVPAILNFAPVTIPPIRGTLVKNVDLTLFLENLSYQLASRGR